MSAPTTPRLVYFAEEVCDALGISRSTLERLRRHRAFPIPELRALDRRPRWSRAEVDRFVAEGRSLHVGTVARRRGERNSHLRAVNGVAARGGR